MANKQKEYTRYETSIIGYPRIGENRELKKLTESYFSQIKDTIDGESTSQFLKDISDLRQKRLQKHIDSPLTYTNIGDFSLWDKMLDMIELLGVIPEKYKELGLNPTDTYFAMAKGYQSGGKDVEALDMKKWCDTNYHYIVPSISNSNVFHPNNIDFSSFDVQLQDAIQKNARNVKVSLIGPLTFLKLSKFLGSVNIGNSIDAITSSYKVIVDHIIEKCNPDYIQIEEPSLVTDLTQEEKEAFQASYQKITEVYDNILLQTYFGYPDKDVLEKAYDMNFKGIGLDFVDDQKRNEEIIAKIGFPKEKALFAGIVNGHNIWTNDYQKSVSLVERLSKSANNIVLSTSSSLLHSPYTLQPEVKIPDQFKKHLSFADEKIQELDDIKQILNNNDTDEVLPRNRQIIEEKKQSQSLEIAEKINNLSEEDFTREIPFSEREKIQSEKFGLPVLPTTTIGSFPQTQEVRKLRRLFKKGELSEEEYTDALKKKTKETVELQEELGLDVPVHGEYERNDMVEYFGENLDGFLFTQNGWVQSYGTRGVKPPIIFGDVSRKKPMTVEWSKYAQSLTKKPMKGMLTGPVTILNWSFPREDIPLKDIAYQIALAIRDEVLGLEKAGIDMIQIDEAALREKLPLRREDWEEYLDWAIKSFRLVHSKVKPETQIHTHMCYSQFKDIMPAIKDMDADVITIETSRSDLGMLDALKESDYDKQVGPGVYDIHSPNIADKEKMKRIIWKMIEKLPLNKLWVNPDCGLKTRKEPEVKESLKNMVEAAKEVRAELDEKS